MQRKLGALAATFLAMALAFPAMGASKTYQVTGEVLKVTDKIIVVQKANDEKWEVDRSGDTKVTGELKVGAKVTIFYRMEAESIEVKK